MGRLTKTEICSRALEVVGNTDILARAELWADLLLDETARTHRWPQLQKQHSVGIVNGTTAVDWPSDYGFLVYSSEIPGVGVFQDSGGGRTAILEMSGSGSRSNPLYSLDNRGTPQYVGDDHQNSQWILYPVSNVAGTIYLEYHSVPAAIASGGTPWYPNDLSLMNAIVDLAERHERGKLVNLEAAIKTLSSKLALAAPSRAKLWMGGGKQGALDPRWFSVGGG